MILASGDIKQHQATDDENEYVIGMKRTKGTARRSGLCNLFRVFDESRQMLLQWSTLTSEITVCKFG